MTHLRICLLILLMAGTGAAQDQPDFSGRWVLDAPPRGGAEIPAALSVRQLVVRTTIHGEPMKPYFSDITIDRHFESGTRSETHPIGVVGGSVSGPAGSAERTVRKSLHGVNWDGTSLVFESGSYTGESPDTDTWAERREVWSLDPDGRLRIVVTTRHPAERPNAVTLLYRRSVYFNR
jgi:hypothetical protein